jgi:hypothetical protein
VSTSDYLEKLRRKPAREKERIAIFATAVAFLFFLGIWMVSFSETTKENSESQAASSALSSQLEDLKGSVGQGKQSIQNMMQGAQQSGANLNNPGTAQNLGSDTSPVDNSNSFQNNQDTLGQNNVTGDQPQEAINNQQNNKQEIPNLP